MYNRILECLNDLKIKDSDFGQLLHSYKIKFPHPRTGKILEFEKEPPEEFENILHSLVD